MFSKILLEPWLLRQNFNAVEYGKVVLPLICLIVKEFQPSEPLTLGSFRTSSLHQRPIKQNVFRLKTDSENVDKPTDIFSSLLLFSSSLLNRKESEAFGKCHHVGPTLEKRREKTFYLSTLCFPSFYWNKSQDSNFVSKCRSKKKLRRLGQERRKPFGCCRCWSQCFVFPYTCQRVNWFSSMKEPLVLFIKSFKFLKLKK